MSNIQIEWTQGALLGQGGFGSVYRGTLKDQENTTIAIKRLFNVPEGGFSKE